uniref:Uncharacterized protein n=1 Tax=Cannabis sativa TaxID=3483 RepID=A0A803QRG0_CANSA
MVFTAKFVLRLSKANLIELFSGGRVMRQRPGRKRAAASGSGRGGKVWWWKMQPLESGGGYNDYGGGNGVKPEDEAVGCRGKRLEVVVVAEGASDQMDLPMQAVAAA